MLQRPDVTVTINGAPVASVLGGTANFTENEEGLGHSATWLKDARIDKPGTYIVSATSQGKTATVSWEVFGTPERPAAKNVILFIGDGLSIAHRTAARMLSRGIKEGRYGGELAMDDMPLMALVSTAGHRLYCDRQRQLDVRVHNWAQVLRQCPRCLLCPQQKVRAVIRGSKR